MRVLILLLLLSGNLWAVDPHWSFETLVKVMEDRGFDKWQRGDKLFMKGLRYARDHGIDVTESGVMDSLVIKGGGFYFRKDPVSLNFNDIFKKEIFQK